MSSVSHSHILSHDMWRAQFPLSCLSTVPRLPAWVLATPRYSFFNLLRAPPPTAQINTLLLLIIVVSVAAFRTQHMLPLVCELKIKVADRISGVWCEMSSSLPRLSFRNNSRKILKNCLVFIFMFLGPTSGAYCAGKQNYQVFLALLPSWD